MAHNAYCNECGSRVRLTESGECENGHPRSALRDVREGELDPAAIAQRTSGPAVTGPPPPGPDAGAPNPTRAQENVSAVMGRLIVIVPAVLVITIGLWTVYAFSRGMGQSQRDAWFSSIGSMLLTGVTVAVVVWNRRRKMHR